MQSTESPGHARVVAAAVVPSPPALVPQVATGAAHLLDELRSHCDAAVAALVGAGAEMIAVVATGRTTGRRPASERADLTPYGLPLVLGGGEGPGLLPLGLTLGTWLLDRAGWSGQRTLWSVRPDAGTAQCRELAEQLVHAETGRVGVLCVGDGSARREDSSPRWPDPRAVGYDRAVAAALGAADTDALLALDPTEAAELAVDGRAPWQVLAAATTTRLRGRLLCEAAPFGVGYAVALWTEPATRG